MQNFSETQNGYVRIAFNALDKDSDGSVTCAEIRKVMSALDMEATDTDVQDLMNEADFDGNGSMELNEFSALMMRRFMNSEVNDQELHDAFKVMSEGSELITVQTLQNIFIKLRLKITEPDIEAMISASDFDGDHGISYEEFCITMSTR